MFWSYCCCFLFSSSFWLSHVVVQHSRLNSQVLLLISKENSFLSSTKNKKVISQMFLTYYFTVHLVVNVLIWRMKYNSSSWILKEAVACCIIVMNISLYFFDHIFILMGHLFFCFRHLVVSIASWVSPDLYPELMCFL